MINNKVYIIIMGVLIVVVFSYVSFVNIIPNNSSNSYFSSNESKIDAIIKEMRYSDGRLIVTTSGNAKKGCIKSTRSNPDIYSKCWVSVSDNVFSSSIYKYKKYYVWIMDNNGVISNFVEYQFK